MTELFLWLGIFIISLAVLIDDNFASIVAGVEEGRKTYDNIKKFVKYMLAVNFSSINDEITLTLITITNFMVESIN